MAEELAAAHMRQLGFLDAKRTKAGADGGIDVVSADAVAQVKFLSHPVGSPDVQRLKGAAHEVEHAIFYSSSGYSEAAATWAQGAGVALFAYDTRNSVSPVNAAAAAMTKGTDASLAIRAGKILASEREGRHYLTGVLNAVTETYFTEARASQLTPDDYARVTAAMEGTQGLNGRRNDLLAQYPPEALDDLDPSRAMTDHERSVIEGLAQLEELGDEARSIATTLRAAYPVSDEAVAAAFARVSAGWIE